MPGAVHSLRSVAARLGAIAAAACAAVGGGAPEVFIERASGGPSGDADGRPRPPEILLDGLKFPDGVAVMPDWSD